MELQRKWTPEPDGKRENDLKFQKFPVIFPVLREFRPAKGGRDARGPSPHRRSRAGALASTAPPASAVARSTGTVSIKQKIRSRRLSNS
jgi:hypothetical protein